MVNITARYTPARNMTLGRKQENANTIRVEEARVVQEADTVMGQRSNMGVQQSRVVRNSQLVQCAQAAANLLRGGDRRLGFHVFCAATTIRMPPTIP